MSTAGLPARVRRSRTGARRGPRRRRVVLAAWDVLFTVADSAPSRERAREGRAARHECEDARWRRRSRDQRA